ncbi:MAG: ferritin-like domain-containing protein [Polyangiaceae bacterium]
MCAPTAGTVERWAWDYVRAGSLEGKLSPPAVPEAWEAREPAVAPVRRLEAPGRPPELRVVSKAGKTRGLATPIGRARALHTFFHHELQAAELMAWAVLAFPDTPRDFRRGLLRIAQDEIRHMHLYAGHIARLGFAVGQFPVRDWFWERVPSCADAASFLATMGLGIESANLEHSASFAARFREAGDEEGARLQERVGAEEIAHVRFAATWFRAFRSTLDFDAWRRALAPPLSPLLMRGQPLQREARLRAGQTEQFLDELEAWQPDSPGS